ncbi:MAG: DUF192 domain-containing protein [Ignavibacteria bacterium]
MKQEKKNTSSGKDKNAKVSAPGYSKYFLIAALIAVAGYFTYEFAFKEETKVTAPVVVDPRERIKNVKEPQFVKEGELEFLKKDKKQVIRKIEVEVADNDREREIGLMYRKSMDDNKGMFFIFNKEEPQSFWMKNTIMPLDIMYVNLANEIVKIHKNTVPFSESSIPSGKPATYVVEVAAGFTDRHGIAEGDLISFRR